MYDHDPEDDFIEVAPSYADLFARLKAHGMRVVPDRPAGETDPCLIVTRATDAWKSILYPIGLDEWSEYLRTDPTMKDLGYREGTNPFTKEVIRTVRPGHAVWELAPGTSISIEYRFGRLTMKGDDAHYVGKMKRIAQALNARLFGPDGAEIEVG